MVKSGLFLIPFHLLLLGSLIIPPLMPLISKSYCDKKVNSKCWEVKYSVCVFSW